MRNNWNNYTIRFERDGGRTLRTPSGRAIGWFRPDTVDFDLNTFCRKGAKLDVSRAPAVLNVIPVFES